MLFIEFSKPSKVFGKISKNLKIFSQNFETKVFTKVFQNSTFEQKVFKNNLKYATFINEDFQRFSKDRNLCVK